jgi:hypothetical protein
MCSRLPIPRVSEPHHIGRDNRPQAKARVIGAISSIRSEDAELRRPLVQSTRIIDRQMTNGHRGLTEACATCGREAEGGTMLTNPKLVIIEAALMASALMTHAAVAGETVPSSTKPTQQPSAERQAIATTEPAKSSPETADRNARVTARLDLSEHVIRHAIADASETDTVSREMRPASFGGSRASGQERIDQKFKDADIPTCMTMDAWKIDPPRIGPIPIPGFFAAPWLIRNIVTGRCRH